VKPKAKTRGRGQGVAAEPKKKPAAANELDIDDYQDEDDIEEESASDAEQPKKKPAAANKVAQKKPATTWAGETGSATLEDNKDDDANKEDKAPAVKACDSSGNFFVMRYLAKGIVAVRCRTTKKQVLSVWALPS
jgi:hypothetical protein